MATSNEKKKVFAYFYNFYAQYMSLSPIYKCMRVTLNQIYNIDEATSKVNNK